jgi:hypothetical protein
LLIARVFAIHSANSLEFSIDSNLFDFCFLHNRDQVPNERGRFRQSNIFGILYHIAGISTNKHWRLVFMEAN